MTLLVCKKCSQAKPEEDFPVASVTKTGRAGECRSCKATRMKNQRQERAKMLLEMFKGRCHDCNVEHDNPSFFDFHHVDKRTKEREVKQIINGSLKALMREAQRCVMLCPNCHRERHLKEGW